MPRLVIFLITNTGFLFFLLWQPLLAAGRSVPLSAKLKNHTFLPTSQAELLACLLYPMTTKRSVIVAATVSQTITNSDYRASANGNFSATGAPSVVTLIEAETTQPVRVYLPVLLKKLASSLK